VAPGAPADPAIARAHLCLALDVDDLVAAVRLARSVAEWFGTVKVGLELFGAAGPEAVGTLRELGFEVFVDLKLHDIPTTVERAARVLGALGADLLTLHAMGGVRMLRAGVEGLADGAARAGLEPPVALAVTVLTSDDGDLPPHVFPRRVAHALEAGCGGVVCAPTEARLARQLGPRLRIVTPGIRPRRSPPGPTCSWWAVR
jgi:orotidine-5'-phosphate decarboxylase